MCIPETKPMRQPGSRLFYTCPRPFVTAVVITLLLGGGTVAGYFILGCENDWLLVSGLLLDILGALTLAVPDVPRLWSQTIIDDLRTAVDRLSKGTLDEITESDAIYDALYETVDERLSLQGAATFELVKTLSVTDLGTDVPLRLHPAFEQEFIVDDASDSPIHFAPAYIIESLRNKIHAESGRFRRLGLYLIVVGFSVQGAATLSSNTVVLTWGAAVLSRLGIAVGAC